MKDHSSQVRACEEWFNTQKEEIVEFRKTSEQYAEGKINESELNKLIEKTMSRFRDFAEKRSRLAQSDVTPFLAPPWCSSLENSAAWVGGCRPSSFFSLVYGLCGRDIEKQLAQYLQGDRFDFGHLSAEQLEKVDALQRRIVRYENSYSVRLAELQNDMLDQPLAASVETAVSAVPNSGDADSCESSGMDANKIIEKHGRNMASLVEDADKLRLKAVEEIVDILTPAQAMVFLASGKKAWVCMHELGRHGDREHGRM